MHGPDTTADVAFPCATLTPRPHWRHVAWDGAPTERAAVINRLMEYIVPDNSLSMSSARLYGKEVCGGNLLARSHGAVLTLRI